MINTKQNKKQTAEVGHWKEGTVKEFLQLSDVDMELIELRMGLARLLKETRLKTDLTQEKAARILHTSQSRLAKMEGGDPSVTFDLLVKSVLTLGVSRNELLSRLAL